MTTEPNGAEIIEELIQTAEDAARRQYLDRVWAMNKTEMFGELMRVHTESNRLLLVAQTQIQALQEQILKYGNPVH
jgi:recombinational DNA repair ATPase RecF